MKVGRGAVAAGDKCYFSRWDGVKPHSLDVHSPKRCYTIKDAGRSGASGAFAGWFRGRFVGPGDTESGG